MSVAWEGCLDVRQTVPTPVPNLRGSEWLERLRRWTRDAVHPKNRRRTTRRVVIFLASTFAIALFKEAIHLSVVRLKWEPPPGNSAERLGVDRVERQRR